MNFQQLLQPEIQKYIEEHTSADVTKLALQKNPFPEIDFKLILNQINARAKAKTKLPAWFNAKNIIYPSKISIEQTSSETTANYKSQLVSGESLIDLSGGFGVDDYYFSKKIKQLTHCEINPELSEIVAHNFKQLGCLNIACIAGESLETLTHLNQKFSWLYIDPSRRNETKGKVFMLKDCTPNVPELQEKYFQFSDNILLKTAPILDISAALIELKNVKTIHIIAVENEVKELLFHIEKNYENSITIQTINHNKFKKEIFDFQPNNNFNSTYSLPKKHLYEPNAAIMKSGGFHEITNQFPVEKLHQHSHLYTSDNCIDFPGRIFQINAILPYDKNEIAKHLENKKANITTRNFPKTVENIRKKIKIKDGGNDYCFFTTDKNNNKIVLLCTKINLK